MIERENYEELFLPGSKFPSQSGKTQNEDELSLKDMLYSKKKKKKKEKKKVKQGLNLRREERMRQKSKSQAAVKLYAEKLKVVRDLATIEQAWPFGSQNL